MRRSSWAPGPTHRTCPPGPRVHPSSTIRGWSTMPREMSRTASIPESSPASRVSRGAPARHPRRHRSRRHRRPPRRPRRQPPSPSSEPSPSEPEPDRGSVPDPKPTPEPNGLRDTGPVSRPRGQGLPGRDDPRLEHRFGRRRSITTRRTEVRPPRSARRSSLSGTTTSTRTATSAADTGATGPRWYRTYAYDTDDHVVAKSDTRSATGLGASVSMDPFAIGQTIPGQTEFTWTAPERVRFLRQRHQARLFERGRSHLRHCQRQAAALLG